MKLFKKEKTSEYDRDGSGKRRKLRGMGKGLFFGGRGMNNHPRGIEYYEDDYDDDHVFSAVSDETFNGYENRPYDNTSDRGETALKNSRYIDSDELKRYLWTREGSDSGEDSYDGIYHQGKASSWSRGYYSDSDAEYEGYAAEADSGQTYQEQEAGYYEAGSDNDYPELNPNRSSRKKIPVKPFLGRMFRKKNSDYAEKPQRKRLKHIRIKRFRLSGRGERRRRRRISRAGIKALIILIVLLLVAAAVVTFAALDRSGKTDIKNIYVKGNVHYEVLDIIDIAKAKTDVNVFTVRTHRMEERLEKIPYIKKANVYRKLPDSLVISVTERIPKYAIYFGGAYLYTDEDFVMLERKNESGGLIILEGYPAAEIKTGNTFKCKNERTMEVTGEIIKVLEEKSMTVYKLSYKSGLLNVYFSPTLMVEGSFDNISRYMGEINEILYSLSLEGIERGIIHVGDNGYISFSPKT